jgi:hypothetical protein
VWLRHPGPPGPAGAQLRFVYAAHPHHRPQVFCLSPARDHRTCFAGLRRRLRRVFIALTLCRDQNDGRFSGVSVSLICSRFARNRASSAGVFPSTHSAAAAIRLDEEPTLPLLAGHRVVLHILFGVDSFVADAHELRLTALDGVLRGIVTTSFAHPPPIQPCSVPSARTIACAPT